MGFTTEAKTEKDKRIVCVPFSLMKESDGTKFKIVNSKIKKPSYNFVFTKQRDANRVFFVFQMSRQIKNHFETLTFFRFFTTYHKYL